MRILVLIAFASLLTGCTSPSPATLETQQPTQSQTDAPPEATESPAAPETDMPTETVQEAVEQEVRTETSATEAQPQETTAAAPRATTTATPSQTPSPTKTQATATPTATPTQTQTPIESRLSMANIAKNNSTASCWVAISGNAYDLTKWIAGHPGGAGAITGICGTDATSRFQGQHGGQSQPLSTLDGYLLGAVGS